MNLNNQCVKTVTKAIASGSRFQLMSIKCADCGTDYATLQEVIDCTHGVTTCLR